MGSEQHLLNGLRIFFRHAVFFSGDIRLRYIVAHMGTLMGWRYDS